MSAPVTFMAERWSHYYPECVTLWEEHYAEFGPVHAFEMEMAPDIAVYEAADRAGQLQIVVARSAGKMVGYCLVFCRPHIHYCKSICGFEDSFFISKPFRRGRVGIEIFKFTTKLLKARGIKRAYFMSKDFNGIAKIFHYLGMRRMDEVFVWGV